MNFWRIAYRIKIVIKLTLFAKLTIIVFETGVEKQDSITSDQTKNVKYHGINIGTEPKSCLRQVIVLSNKIEIGSIDILICPKPNESYNKI